MKPSYESTALVSAPTKFLRTVNRVFPPFLLAALLAPSFFWVLQDRTVWPWDSSWYGEVSADLCYRLANLLHRHGLKEWLREMVQAIPMKPPGIVWLGQFFVGIHQIFGSVEASLLVSVLLTQFITLYFIYRIGITLAPKSRLVPLVGVVFAASGQIFIGLSHQFLVEPLQTLAVTWVFLIAVCCHSWSRAKILLHLAAALILGALAKTTTPMYCLAPGLCIMVVFLRRHDKFGFRRELDKWPSRTLLLFSLSLGPLGVLWYEKNFASVMQHVRDATTSSIALDYGYRAPITSKLITWSGLFRMEFLDPYIMWGCALLIVGAILSLIPSRNRGVARQTVALVLALILISAIQIAVVLLVLSSNIMIESRFLLPLLPGAAILVMGLASLVAWRPALVVVIVLCFWQWAKVNHAAFRADELLPHRSAWLSALNRDETRYAEMTRLVQATTTRAYAYNIFAIELPWFNANSASFFAAKNRLSAGIRCYYTSIGYAQKDPRAAMQRIADIQAVFVITLDDSFYTIPPELLFLNQAAVPVLEELRRDPTFTLTPFNSRLGVLVFRRAPNTAPLAPAITSGMLAIPATSGN